MASSQAIQEWMTKIRKVSEERKHSVTETDIVQYLLDEFGGTIVKREIIERMPHQSTIPDPEYQAYASKIARWILAYLEGKQWVSSNTICLSASEAGMKYSSAERVCRKLAEHGYLERSISEPVSYKIKK